MTEPASEQEAALVIRAQAGDSAAFQILVHQNLPGIQQYAARLLGSPIEAADISQEVFIKFWQKSKTFDPERAKLSTWLHRITHNLCMDHFRQHHLRKDGRVTGLEEREEPTSALLESELARRERIKLMKSLIASLPERQRSALILCHYQGLSNKQAANILDISVDALESLLSRARRSLKNTLEEQGL